MLLGDVMVILLVFPKTLNSISSSSGSELSSVSSSSLSSSSMTFLSSGFLFGFSLGSFGSSPSFPLPV